MRNKWQGDSFNVRNQEAKIQGFSEGGQEMQIQQ